MKPFVLFDFDGTLVQSKLLAVRLFNDLAGKYGGRRIAEEEIGRLSDLSIPDRLRALNVPLYKLPALALEGKRAYRKESVHLRLAEGMRETLGALREQGCRLGILSSNTNENIRHYLEANGLDFFEAVHSASNLFGKDKAIRSLARTLGLELSQLLYVGDEFRDVEACRKIDVPVAAVTWGWDSAKLLAEAGPDYLCYSPAELSSIVKGWE
ncbi:phosphoglycolate phosphatase [Paenibacillus sp. UNC496MF]|uniref:HAD-IA family hydrolase n=1 Tax=Paenibacillus sp. UNC496MF TaxID=1502753 RepID=UPI0008E90073|nr:HAD-IA family hydrolase [Paenibacillus sp. UNC496MF]SFJ40376.1 phosphoglycolate phosphatase [Paenibacillus sp. UNC496MF]